MDRPFWYYGPVLRDTDLLNAARFPMVGLAKLSEAVLGTGIAVQGFATAPTVPASMSVNVGPGQVYQLANLEATQWAAFGPDTHSIVKQGVALDPQPQTFVAPTTAGYAQNFLIQVAYADQDQGATALPYYNAANPQQPYSGPGNSGTQQNTIRAGVANVTVKAGVAANSGSQTTPTPDSGYAGLFVVTVSAGQTTITAGNITAYANAPFIPVTLPGVPSAVQSGKYVYAVDSGTASNLILTLNPAPSALSVGQEIVVRPAASPTGASVANVNGLAAVPVVRRGGLATASGDWNAGDVLLLGYTGSSLMVAGLVPSDVLSIIKATSPVYTPSATLYVRNDSTATNPTGLTNTVSDAFPTIAAAITYGTQAYYFPGGALTIQLGVTGNYAAPGAVSAGAGAINIQGSIANQSSYVLTGAGPAGGGSGLVVANACQVNLSGLTVQNSGTNNYTVNASSGGNLGLNYVTLINLNGSNSLFQIGAVNGTVVMNTNTLFTGSMGGMFIATAGGTVILNANIGLTDTPTYSAATALASVCGRFVRNSNYGISGSAAGPRYSSTLNGVINTNGGGANFFPGSTAGSTSTGGQYV